MRLLLLLGAIGLARAAQAADCNRNGIDDDIDIEVASPGLSPRAGFATPRGAAGLVLADMDRDGLLDLVAHSETEDDVHELLVLISPEPWKTSAPRGLRIGDQSPTDFAVGDIDKDGDPDVVTLTGPGASVHRNGGRGELETVSPVVIGAVPAALALGDLSGDGLLDIVTANSSEPDGGFGNVSVAVNEGNASFLPARNYASGGLGLALLAADMDGDGDLDVALTLREPESGITVLLNDGEGALLEEARSDPSILPHTFIHHLAAGDLDGDGDLDLVITSPDGGASLHGNNGAALLVTAETLTPAAGDQPAVIEDLDEDGDLDIALALRSCPEIEVFVNDVGSFGNSRRFPVERPPSAAGGAFLLRAGDLDGDGDMDVAGFGKRSISLLENTPSGSSTDCNGNVVPDECELDCDANGIPDVCDIQGGAGDCDGDGLLDSCDPRDEDASSVPDACEISSSAAIDCDGNGRIDSVDLEPFLAFPRLAGEPYLHIDAIAAGDLDGDGVFELLVSADGGLRLLRARSIDLARGFLETRLAAASFIAIELVDQDADGDLDIAAAGPQGSCDKGGDGALLVLGNGGSADFGEVSVHPLSSPIPSTIRAADLDGDGTRDIVLFRPSEGVSYLKGVPIPAGDLEDESLALSAPGGLGITPRGMVVADLDGDLDADLALSGIRPVPPGWKSRVQENVRPSLRPHRGRGPGRRRGHGPRHRGPLLPERLRRPLHAHPGSRAPRGRHLVRDLDGDGKADAGALRRREGRHSSKERRVPRACPVPPARRIEWFPPRRGRPERRRVPRHCRGIRRVSASSPSTPVARRSIRSPSSTRRGSSARDSHGFHAGDLDGDGDDDLVATRPGDVRQPIVVLVAASMPRSARARRPRCATDAR